MRELEPTPVRTQRTRESQERATIGAPLSEAEDAAGWLPAIRQCQFFQRLSDTELKLVALICTDATFSGDETVVEAGHRRTSAYLVLEGSVGLFFQGDRDKIPLDQLGPAELVAPTALLDDEFVSHFL